ncbi:MAG: RNA polymerase sigma factor [Pseudobacter sp.]|uniref:RNA polymerase sigma factor n=1 Tax=Pseudobacter sp. TaxID=2045420 RepID=UPI003F822DFA
MPSEPLHTNHTLLLRIAEGQQDAFAELHGRYWNEVYSLALAFLKNPHQAEDLVQEVFLKLWVKRDQLPSIKDFTPYFMVMVRNEIIDAVRRMARQQKKHAQYISNLIEYPQQPLPLSDADTAARIRKALAELTERQLLIFSLSRDEGLSHEAIAERLGISKKTVSNTITQVLNHLRTSLSSRGLMALLMVMMIKK